MNLLCGVKIYDNDWFLRHGLSIERAADLLAGWGVTYVIAQSRYLPMQDSAVASAVTGADRERYEALDDVAFRAALAERGIGYFACLNIGFDPVLAASPPRPAADRPIRKSAPDAGLVRRPAAGSSGEHRPQARFARRAPSARCNRTASIWFLRWPGFWETWLPGDDRAAKPEYCFYARRLARFRASTGAPLALELGPTEAAVIHQQQPAPRVDALEMRSDGR